MRRTLASNRRNPATEERIELLHLVLDAPPSSIAFSLFAPSPFESRIVRRANSALDEECRNYNELGEAEKKPRPLCIIEDSAGCIEDQAIAMALSHGDCVDADLVVTDQLSFLD